jgi:ketosteroid isomerase-like protein
VVPARCPRHASDWENQSVSEPNIGVVQRAFDAIGRRDLDAVLEEVDPNVELHPFVSVWRRTYRGHAGIEQWSKDVAELWEEFSVLPRGFRDLGDDALLVLAQWHGRGKGSTTAIDGPAAVVIRFRDGKAASVDVYLDEAHALKSVELRE